MVRSSMKYYEILRNTMKYYKILLSTTKYYKMLLNATMKLKYYYAVPFVKPKGHYFTVHTAAGIIIVN